MFFYCLWIQSVVRTETSLQNILQTQKCNQVKKMGNFFLFCLQKIGKNKTF